MRALAFPQDERAESADTNGTLNGDIGIPIDPALIDPLSKEQKEEAMDVVMNDLLIVDEIQPLNGSRRFYDGPQGDPFAPQPPPFFPIEQPPPERLPLISSKPPKKRRHKPEPTCGFCYQDGSQETLLSCHDCGRSAHPRCLQIQVDMNAIRLDEWCCNDCKDCQVCRKKGDEERMIFCDNCDTGWHLYCMDPPLEQAPEGRWHCPQCPPVLSLFHDPHSSFPMDHPTLRESSIASTSSPIAPAPSPIKRPANGRSRKSAVVRLMTEDVEVDVVNSTPPTTKRRQAAPPPRISTLRKGKARATEAEEDQHSPVARERKRSKVSEPSLPNRPRVRLRLGKRDDEDQPLKGIFDDFLTEEQRDFSRTMTTSRDKQRFEQTRHIAESKLAVAQPVEGKDETVVGPSSRPLRSAVAQLAPSAVMTPTEPSPSTPRPAFAPGTLRVQTIRFGQYDIQTWYDAPFPEEYAHVPDGRLWICEFCLKYMKSSFGSERHAMKCKARHPPGDEIYRDGSISVFEVDGRKNKIYCSNLCLLSKMFLDHKSLFYDVEPFLFYVITEVDSLGSRFVGYFSKEKRSPKDYNVSCIMTLPVRQRQGWGNLLIDFSYLLSKKERRVGSPEKPLSALGALGYKNYWTLAVMRYLQTAPDNIRLEDISVATSMTLEDVYNTLVFHNLITVKTQPSSYRPSPGQSVKYSKGRKSVARRHLQRNKTQENLAKKNDPSHTTSDKPFVPPNAYEIHWERKEAVEYVKKWEAKGYLRLNPGNLKWSPFLVSKVVLKTDAEEAVGTEALANQEPPSESASSPPAVDEEMLPVIESPPVKKMTRTRPKNGDLVPVGDSARSLRSTRSSASPIKLVKRTSSSRKRMRVESSPELDEDDIQPPQPPLISPAPSDMPDVAAGDQVLSSELSTAPVSPLVGSEDEDEDGEFDLDPDVTQS